MLYNSLVDFPCFVCVFITFLKTAESDAYVSSKFVSVVKCGYMYVHCKISDAFLEIKYRIMLKLTMTAVAVINEQ